MNEEQGTEIKGKIDEAVYEGLNVIGINQHHDAITGTARWKVNLDY